MNLSITLEHRFNRTPDGTIWTPTTLDYSFWERYLDVFDRVCPIARVEDVSKRAEDWKRVDGKNVEVIPLPYYLGPMGYLLQFQRLQSVIRHALNGRSAVIMRVPSQIATSAETVLHATGQPYGVEVVGDPYDVFAPGAMRHPLRPFFRWWFTRNLRRQCAGAAAAAYVTGEALQRRYPASSSAFATHYSSIQLDDSAFVGESRSYETLSVPVTLVYVGSLAQMYKAPDVLIDAVARCVGAGVDLRLGMIGDGKHRAELEAQAATLGIAGHVDFIGQLPAGEAVRTQLDKADVFVLPSHQEGLPRAMIEAMARGLPCIGSTVGGIPELLPATDMVAPGDASALADKIMEVVTNPTRMAAMSARNLTKARAYHENLLQARRIAFYQHLREKTQQWIGP